MSLKEYTFRNDKFLYNLADDEINVLVREYALTGRTLLKVRKYYSYYPEKLGRIKKTIKYFDDLFKDYKLEEGFLASYFDTFSELAYSSTKELERKLVVLNSLGLMDTILFEFPYALLENNVLTSDKIYAIGRHLAEKGETPSYENIYLQNYGNEELTRIVNSHPLNLKKYNMYKIMYDISRKKMREKEDGDNPFSIK